jgi:trehalose synthase
VSAGRLTSAGTATARLQDVPISPFPLERFRTVLGERYSEVEDAIERALELLTGRAIWHINSTPAGGGVAELLHSLLAYARGAGADVRWSVIEGDPEFYGVTKRIHNRLHGVDGDLAPLSADDREVYLRVQEVNAEALAELVAPGDVVYLHDPQTAGMTARMVDTGATVIWRCHVGADRPDAPTRAVWQFLQPLIEPAHQYVFSRTDYVWGGLDRDKVSVIEPSIDAFSPKNEELSAATVAAILDRIGLAPDGGIPAMFQRHDGTTARVDRHAQIAQDEPLPPAAPVLAQVSRWDRLKDPIGVLEGFVAGVTADDAHLLLVGPIADGVADDPEGFEVYEDVRAARAALDPEIRRRVHLVSLPMDDVAENAAMVNAIQRRATVVAQKSIAEGFGLTATEAMWKATPVIVSAVGGLQEQVVDGVTGVVIEDPTDVEAFGRAANDLLGDPERVATMGAAAHERVRDHYLGTRHLIQYVNLLSRMLA